MRLRVQPRASRNEVVGWQEGTLRVRVTAPPLEGAANRALLALLGRALGVRSGAIRLIHGEHGRDKLVRVTGLSLTEIEARVARVGPR